jgi:integrase
MASLRKRGRNWFFRFIDADGAKREVKGCADKRVTEEMARAAESEAALIRSGSIDPRALAYRREEARPLSDHLDDYQSALRARGNTPQYARLHSDRARRIVALVAGGKLAEFDAPKTSTKAGRAKASEARARILLGARFADLSTSGVQEALATLRAVGRSLQTLNHHRAAIRGFVLWAIEDKRLRDDPIRKVVGFNAKEDRRHDRRTLAVDELRRLIDTTHAAPDHRGMTGTDRALCYRLAVASGLRYAELGSITPERLDLAPERPSVTILASYAKNGQTVTLPLARDLAADLLPIRDRTPPGQPIFTLPPDEGADMLRFDLELAEIAYRDESGQVFDFHALRCQCATLADAAGVSPRVVQRLMRHSNLEMTNRYTRPRMHDLEGAAASLPSLRPGAPGPESVAATGTDGKHIENRLAHHLPTAGDVSGRELAVAGGSTESAPRTAPDRNPLEITALDASGRKLSSSVASDRGGARTLDQRINLPWTDQPKVISSNALRIAGESIAHPVPTDTRQTDPDLALIAERWESLPPSLRAGIVAMVRGATRPRNAPRKKRSSPPSNP